MDGLSIFQAIFGGLQVIGKVYEAADKLHNAPGSIKGLLVELSITERILKQLRPLIVDNESPLTEDAQHVKLGDLVLVFTDLAKTLSSFDQFVTNACAQSGIRGNTLFKQTLWVKNEQKFQRDLSRLQHHKASLAVILALLDRYVLLTTTSKMLTIPLETRMPPIGVHYTRAEMTFLSFATNYSNKLSTFGS